MKKILTALALIFALNAQAEMLVDDIRIEGLQRVSLGSVLDTVPITIGDKIEKKRLSKSHKDIICYRPV